MLIAELFILEDEIVDAQLSSVILLLVIVVGPDITNETFDVYLYKSITFLFLDLHCCDLTQFFL